MSDILDALSNPQAMSQAQWLVLAIAGFIIIGSMYFIWKLSKVLRTVGKSTYKPNIGFSRTGYKHPPRGGDADNNENKDEAKAE